MRRFIATILGVGLSACASTRAVPTELTAARTSYSRATGAPGSSLVPAEIHQAKVSLDAAEAAFRSNDDEERSYVVRDLAYVAQRKAELAEALAAGAVAVKDEAAGAKSVSLAHSAANQAAAEQLAVTRQELARARQETSTALSQLSSAKRQFKQDARGTVITLSGNVLFGSNDSHLLPSAHGQLDDIARVLTGAQGQSIAIEGYTDATGSRQGNDRLSQDRADSVMLYLRRQGVKQEQMRAVGRGPQSPIADNSSAEGRATNRRVEIVVQPVG